MSAGGESRKSLVAFVSLPALPRGARMTRLKNLVPFVGLRRRRERLQAGFVPPVGGPSRLGWSRLIGREASTEGSGDLDL